MSDVIDFDSRVEEAERVLIGAGTLYFTSIRKAKGESFTIRECTLHTSF